MREVPVKEITQVVRDLFIDANVNLGEDVVTALQQALESEESATGKEVLTELIENARIAKAEGIPLCQDTGLPVVFIELGQEVHLTGGDLFETINEGIRQGSQDGSLRPSVCHCLTPLMFSLPPPFGTMVILTLSPGTISRWMTAGVLSPVFLRVKQ